MSKVKSVIMNLLLILSLISVAIIIFAMPLILLNVVVDIITGIDIIREYIHPLFGG